MTYWEKHKPTIIIVIGLCIVAGIITYFGNKSIAVSGALANSSSIKTMEQYKGAVIETNMGSIEIAFIPEKTPNTVKNFIKLADKGFFDQTKFHRVIKDFMIQGGDPNSKGDDERLYGTGGPGYQFADEPSDERLVKGVVAMANSGPNTNGSQFFIITAPETPWLQGIHTPFAKVVSGMDVVEKISAVKTKTGDIPVSPVIVEKVILK